jgi:1,4-dihydroxy-2-naphthoate octaprenyltransferase
MWAPMSFGLLIGSVGSFSAGRVGLGVFFSVVLVGLWVFVGIKARQSASRQP